MANTRTLAKIGAGLVAGALGALSGFKARDERYVTSIWQTLEQASADDRVFSAAMVADLPDPARRYFLHAIRPGTPLATRLRLHYTAQMKPGTNLPWMALKADQILVRQRGFVWKATARKGLLSVTVRDHYLDGNGRMRVAVFGWLPVVRATGHDLSKSALGRLVIEGVMLPPALLPGPNVEIEGVDDARFTVTTHLDGESVPITVTVDADGRPTEVTMLRWGNLTGDGAFRAIPYGMRIDGEQTFRGYTIPAGVAGGWWYGTDQYREVNRLKVDTASFR